MATKEEKEAAMGAASVQVARRVAVALSSIVPDDLAVVFVVVPREIESIDGDRVAFVTGSCPSLGPQGTAEILGVVAATMLSNDPDVEMRTQAFPRGGGGKVH